MTYALGTRDDYARLVIQAGRDLGITPRGIVIGLVTVYVESAWKIWANRKVAASLVLPYDDIGSDGYSVGLFQQQVRMSSMGWWWGDAETCMDPYQSARLFFGRLARLDYNNTSRSPGSYAQQVQQSAYPDRYDQRMNEAQALYGRLTRGNVPDVPAKPAFNEYAMWSPSNSGRGGKKPTVFLLHTQEGPGNADSLARYLSNPANQVSYHYSVSQADDGGVTVCDVVDTDKASWSVGNANSISINLCFAGSRASWTRDQWMQQAKAIDVAAYLAVQDCHKYGMSTLVVPPPYAAGTPGISDHNWVTKIFGWGTHTDVGVNFPWDIFALALAKYIGDLKPINPPTTPEVPVPDDKIDYIYGQLQSYPQLAGKPDALDALRKKIADGVDLTLVDAVAAHIHGLFTAEVTR